MLSAPTILNKINGVLISFSLQNVQLGNRYGSNKIIVIPDTSFRPRCNMDNDTLAGVKFLHAAGTLCGSYPASNRITNAVFIVTMPYGEHGTDDDVIIKLQVFAPLCMIVYLRISLLVRIVVKQHKLPILLLSNILAYQHKNTWIHTVEDNLKFIASHSDKFQELKDAPLRDWVSLISRNARLFKKALVDTLSMPVFNKVAFW